MAAEPAVVALLQAAMRRRLITRERAVDMAEGLVGCGEDPAELRRLLAGSPDREAIMLLQLLPAVDLAPIGGWQRLACLGEGRTASTWLGIGADRHLVVIKVLHPNRVPPGAEADRFKDEARELIGLGSRYLVDYRAARRGADGRAALVMEYVPGRALHARASTKGPMPEAKALPLLRQAAKGLHVLEHHGRCHGMLHPGNILVSADGRARLSDYGMALSATRHGLRPGWDARSLLLHAWAAPETLSGSAMPTPAGDQYALACIAYWLLTGQPPFAGPPDDQALKQQTAPRPDVRVVAPRISGHTASAIAKAMALDPCERFISALEFANALHRSYSILVGAPKREAPVELTPMGGVAVIDAPAPQPPPLAVDYGDNDLSGRRPVVRRTRRRRR